MPDAQAEPDITINGKRLTAAQAMTVRVAIQSFAMELEHPWNEYGPIGPAYLDRIQELNALMN